MIGNSDLWDYRMITMGSEHPPPLPLSPCRNYVAAGLRNSGLTDLKLD